MNSALICAILGTSLLSAADLSTYRGFQFGSTLAEAAKQAGAKPSEAKSVHQRPAVIQELDWRPAYSFQADAKNGDPVREGVLSFYNGRLFQIVTTYDRQRIEGMTDADMVEAISQTYGVAAKPAVEIPFHSNYAETAPVIARWENSGYTYDLVRTGDQASFALVLRFNHLDTLARAAILEAARLDALEAPQRAIDLQKQQDAENRVTLEKARSLNRPNFRP